MKKFIIALLALCLSVAAFCGCGGKDNNTGNGGNNGENTEQGDGNNNQPENPGQSDNENNNQPENPDPTDNGNAGSEDKPEEPEVNKPAYSGWLATEQGQANLSADGCVQDKIPDFSQYEGTSAYRKVTTAEELVSAIEAAKYHYTNVWNEETKTYTQVPADGYDESNFEGTVHVIEIANSMNLGYNKLSAEVKKSSIIEDFTRGKDKQKAAFTMSDMYLENGMTQIKVENTSNLLVFSKNGAKITHAGFKLNSDYNVVFRNLEFDEMWQWEDAASASTAKVGDYDAFGWAYFKIGFSQNIWIDHCTFGKSYDGQIDYANPVYDANAGTAFRAPYGADGGNGLHISWCKFNSGSKNKNNYVIQMMEAIEQNYQDSLNGGEPCKYLYYKALRDKGIDKYHIWYGIAIPQKKGFLCGDSGNNTTDYDYNLKLNVSFANCTFTNLEDRIPKLRGGNAYFYNCVVDSLDYLKYRAYLSDGGASSAVTKVNDGWKCGLVSQCMLCGNGGSLKAENCIFKGVISLLKNNDTDLGSPKCDGGYQLVNCSYLKTEKYDVMVGSSDTVNFPNDRPATLKTENFSWHTADGKQPYEISPIALDELLEKLEDTTYGAGTTKKMKELWLISNYKSK